jgi:sugar phosphate isomerase/epimerase
LSSLPVAAAVLSNPAKMFAANTFDAKPDSKFGGVQIGVITAYSYRLMPQTDAASVLQYMLTDGVSATEMENTQEEYAGAPKRPAMGRPGGAGGPGGPPAGGPPPAAAGAPRADGAAPRRQMSPEQQAAMAKYAEDLTAWRLSVPMSKFEDLRKFYGQAGVSIYGFKITLNMKMQDAEFDYAFKAAKACGANQITMEMPEDPALTQRMGEFGSKYKMMIGYHAHLQAKPDTWDMAMSQSPYNGINLDIGHYTAAGNHDQLAFIKKNHARITSMHLKDRKYPENGGQNMPWGQGDTPIKEALKLVQAQKYTFPCTIELEYPIPEGSDPVKEVAKCVAYAKAALV